jgi:hypothetical protein
MKVIIAIIFLATSLLFGTCLNKDELANLSPDDLQDSYIDCKKSNTIFEQTVCSDKELSMMFAYFSKTHIDFWMKNLNTSYNYKKIKNDEMKFWNTQYKYDNTSNICFDIKKHTTDLQGGLSPYKMMILNTENSPKYYVQENQYGAIFTDRNGGKNYLGKSCDLLDDKKLKGFWYKKDDSYVLVMDGKFLQLTVNQELLLQRTKCTEEKIKKIIHN